MFLSLQNNENIDDVLHPQDSIRKLDLNDDYNLRKIDNEIILKNHENHEKLENEKNTFPNLKNNNDILVCMHICIIICICVCIYVCLSLFLASFSLRTMDV
jgi:hypothetical protein